MQIILRLSSQKFRIEFSNKCVIQNQKRKEKTKISTIVLGVFAFSFLFFSFFVSLCKINVDWFIVPKVTF